MIAEQVFHQLLNLGGPELLGLGKDEDEPVGGVLIIDAPHLPALTQVEEANG